MQEIILIKYSKMGKIVSKIISKTKSLIERFQIKYCSGTAGYVKRTDKGGRAEYDKN